MRPCSKCKNNYEESEFYHSTRNGKKRPGSWCKNCMNTQTVKRQQKYRREAVELAGGCCRICGYDKCIAALEFHHRDPKQKDFKISKVARSPLTDPCVQAEIKKCILLCANCHREVHAGIVCVS